MHLLTRAFFIFLFGTITSLCHAQNTAAKTSQEMYTLEHSLQQVLDSAGIPGISIAFVDDGELIWSKGFGVSNKESGTSVTEQTIFPAASMGKPVFAYAVLKMADAGKIHLDSAVASSIPLEYLEDKFVKKISR